MALIKSCKATPTVSKRTFSIWNAQNRLFVMTHKENEPVEMLVVNADVAGITLEGVTFRYSSTNEVVHISASTPITAQSARIATSNGATANMSDVTLTSTELDYSLYGGYSVELTI